MTMKVMKTMLITDPSIRCFNRFIGVENVMVVVSDDLSPGNPPEELEDVYQSVLSFIGVCPYSIKEVLPIAQHHSRVSVDDVPTTLEISREMYQRLTVFFRPVNNYLMKMVQIDLETWNEQQPPSYLEAKYKVHSKSVVELESTILILARTGNIIALEKELSSQAGSVSIRNKEGRTALMIATINLQIAAVRLVSTTTC